MTITPATIAHALETAPRWALIAMTVPQERLRDDARTELGEHVYRTIFQPADIDPDQLALPL